MKQLTSAAKIFLAEERGTTETAAYRRQQLFAGDDFTNIHKHPFSALYQLTEDTLDRHAAVSLNTATPSLLALMPVYGAVTVKDSRGLEWTVAAGQLLLLPVSKDDSITVHNPFEDELVNYLQAWSLAATAAVCGFDVNKYPGCLVGISPSVMDLYQLPFYLSVGKFAGRQETVHQLRDSRNGIFVLVLSGVFEVQGRLLHAGDGLALCQPAAIDAEALSNDAVMLAVEIPFLNTSF